MPNIVIIGGGPAGLSAAIYAVRAGMQATVLYKDGGALAKANSIENYFGFIEPVSGAELLERGQKQAERLGAVLRQTEVTGIEYAAQGFTVKTADGVFDADAVILATGSPRAVPKIEGVAALEGRGVSYCAICDAFFYRGRAAAVLGQGEYALEEARVLLPVAGSVTLLTNGQSAPENLPDGLAVDTRPVSAVEGGETWFSRTARRCRSTVCSSRSAPQAARISRESSARRSTARISGRTPTARPPCPGCSPQETAPAACSRSQKRSRTARRPL